MGAEARVQAAAAGATTAAGDLRGQRADAPGAAAAAHAREAVVQVARRAARAAVRRGWRARLRARGSEDSAEIERRITRATMEIEVSLTADFFDKIILNEDLDDAYAALKLALEAV